MSKDKFDVITPGSVTLTDNNDAFSDTLVMSRPVTIAWISPFVLIVTLTLIA